MSKMSEGFRPRFVQILVASGLVVGGNVALAQEAESDDSDPDRAPQAMLEEVVVTAERREANLQDVPLAVTAFSETDLQDYQVQNLGDLQSLVPNLSIHVGDANNVVAYIRGVGQVDSVAFFEPGVGIYLDDVYLGRAQGAFLNVLDVERIEVLRGPQGTLYGRNTVGGAIKYVSAAPTNEFSADVMATVGNYNQLNLKAAISGPLLGDALTGRLTVARLERDGYSDNLFDGRDDGDQDTVYARGVLRLEASDSVSIQLAADYTNSDPDRSRTPSKETPINLIVVDPFTFGVSAVSFPADEDPFVVNADFNTIEETETRGIDLNIGWAVNDKLGFRSISSYRELDYGTELDLDATPINAFGIFYFNDQDQTTQEFQLTFEDERLRAVGGLYYFNEEGTTFDGGVFSNLLIALSGDSAFETDSYAAFGQVDYDFTPRLTGIFGVRYTDEEKSYARRAEDFDLTALAGIMIDPVTGAISYANPELLNPGSADLGLDGGIGVPREGASPPPASFDNVSFKAGLQYQINDDAQAYGTWSQGFKSGGFNGRVADAQLEPYDEETLDSYEIGLKAQWLDNRLQTNVALFYTDYEDLQVSSFTATEDGSTFLPVFTNAGAATIAGVELELTAILTDQLVLNANVGYLDAEYDEFLGQPDPETGEVIDISDQREMINAPDWDTFLGLTYTIPQDSGAQFTLLGSWSYRGKTYLEINSSENLAQDAYSLFDASIAWDSPNGRWRIIGNIRNIGDEEYRTHAFDLSAFPGVELGYYNPPRTYSLTGIYRY